MLSTLGSQASGGNFTGIIWDNTLGTSANKYGLSIYYFVFLGTPSYSISSGFLAAGAYRDTTGMTSYEYYTSCYADLSQFNIKEGQTVVFTYNAGDWDSSSSLTGVVILYTDGTNEGIYTTKGAGFTYTHHVPTGKVLKGICSRYYYAESEASDVTWQSVQIGTINVIS
jgi:hypothetical protein